MCVTVCVFVCPSMCTTTSFFDDSGVHLEKTNHDMLRFHHVVFYSQFKSKLGNIHFKTGGLCINLNTDLTFIDVYLEDHTLTPHTLKPLVSYFLPSP